ncbi:methylamine utilization protein MauG [Arcobacter suis]|nr:methylamine utilization protein MauG [Arcobacter suis]
MGILCIGSICLSANEISQKETLGQVLFSDKNLSKNRTQSCATCHNPNAGFADDRENGIKRMASLGDDNKSLGDRQAPTASYAKFSPDFHFDEKKQKYIGGQFWDGRAKTLEEQAGGPPLNPVEMGMGNKKEIIERIKENTYYVQTFKELFGEDIFKDDEKAYDAMTNVIATFERSNEFSPFDSKYDRYLKGEYDLTPLEDLGKSIFFSNNNNSCATCHVLKGEDKAGETFTNYEYHNIGTPANKTLRAKNGVKDIDKGLLANPNVKDVAQNGKHKVPTLRNVAVTAPYMHNGVFKDLKTVIEFYDKYNNKDRNINPETNKPWDDAEVKETIALKELKANALTDRKVEALVAFMKLLTDKKYEYLLEK